MNTKRVGPLVLPHRRGCGFPRLDAALAASCYATDGVFMPTTQPTATAGGMREAYEGIFSVIHLNVTFTIDELVIASDDIAYALTRSNGTPRPCWPPKPKALSQTMRCSSSATRTARGRSPATCSTSQNDPNSRADKASGGHRPANGAWAG